MSNNKIYGDDSDSKLFITSFFGDNDNDFALFCQYIISNVIIGIAM